MQFQISRARRRVGALETDNLALTTKDPELLRSFRDARTKGVMVRGARFDPEFGCVSTGEVRKISAKDPEAVVEWICALRDRGYAVEHAPARK